MGNHSDIAYLRLEKCACSSIIRSLIDKKEEKSGDMYINATEKYEISGNLYNDKSIFKFTYVKNPFERIVSCYVDKIENKKDNNFYNKKLLYGNFRYNTNF